MTVDENMRSRAVVDGIVAVSSSVERHERTTGKVTMIGTDGIIWVRLVNSPADTPCSRSVVSVKVGDTVSVTIRNRRATIDGNLTSPAATVTETEELVQSSAQQVANESRKLFNEAISDAQAAHEAAGRAEKDAQSAADSAGRAAVSAANSERFAASSEESATIAKAASTSAVRDALSANVAANGAISSLGTVQDIMGTLEWMQRNRMFVAAQPPFDATIRYYHVIGDEYAPVENPVACDLGDFYEIRPPYHAPTYDDAPVEGKVYYELVPAHYEAVAEPRAEDMGSYAEIVGGVYAKTQDTEPVEGKTYYVLVPSRFEAVDSPEETDGLYEVRPGGYALTDDESIVEGKQYYSLGQGTYAAVTSPTAKDLATYFELSGGLYVPTRDAQVDSTKTYYRLNSGSYAPVRRANAERLVTYLTIDPKSTMADFMESHLALSQRGLYITQSKAIVNADGTIAFPPGQASYYMLLGHDGMVLFDALGHEVAHYGESAGQDGMWSATSMEASMFAIQRKVEMPDGSIAKEDVFRVGITDDGQQVLHFMLPVPISEGGTGARNEGDAADNLMVQSIGAGMEIPAGTDLNTLTTPGNYVCGFTSNVAGFANKPAPLTNAFRLTVFKVLGNTEHNANEGHRGQLIMDWTSGREYYRVYNGSSKNWGSWRTKRQDTDVIDVLHGGHGGTTVRAAAQNLLVPSLVGSTYLGENTDLNTVVRFGTYYCAGSAVVKTWKNCPTNAALRMTVANGTGQSYDTATLTSVYLVQEIVDLYAYVYRRYSSNGGSTWGEWARSIVSSDVIDRQHGGTGKNITSDPSMLVNLASDSAGLVFVSAPRPGVTGILPLSHGGLGSNTAAGGRSTLGLTGSATAPYDSGCIEVGKYSSYYTGTDGNIYAKRSGGVCTVSIEGVTCKNVGTSRITIAVLPEGYRPKQSIFEHDGLEISTNGNIQMWPNVAANQQKWISVSFALA